jgi:hypothetical protein
MEGIAEGITTQFFLCRLRDDGNVGYGLANGQQQQQLPLDRRADPQHRDENSTCGDENKYGSRRNGRDLYPRTAGEKQTSHVFHVSI